MKKLFLLTLLLSGIEANAGDPYGTLSDCSKSAVQGLVGCLKSHDVSFNMSRNGDTYYIIGHGSPPAGQIQSCISHYNSDSSGCPDAPVVVEKTSDTATASSI